MKCSSEKSGRPVSRKVAAVESVVVGESLARWFVWKTGPSGFRMKYNHGECSRIEPLWVLVGLSKNNYRSGLGQMAGVVFVQGQPWSTALQMLQSASYKWPILLASELPEGVGAFGRFVWTPNCGTLTRAIFVTLGWMPCVELVTHLWFRCLFRLRPIV